MAKLPTKPVSGVRDVATLSGRLERGAQAAVLEIEERDEVVPRHVDRGLLLIGQGAQAVAGPLPRPPIVLVMATCLGSIAMAWT